MTCDYNLCSDPNEDQEETCLSCHHSISNCKCRNEENCDNMRIFQILYIILLVWSIYLASKIKDNENKLLHYTVAILFPPVYILAYYLTV